MGVNIYRLVVPVERECIDDVYRSLIGYSTDKYEDNEQFHSLVSSLDAFLNKIHGIDHLVYKMFNENEQSWSAVKLNSIEIFFFDVKSGDANTLLTESNEFKKLTEVASTPYFEFYVCDLISGTRQLVDFLENCEETGEFWFEYGNFIQAFPREC